MDNVWYQVLVPHYGRVVVEGEKEKQVEKLAYPELAKHKLVDLLKPTFYRCARACNGDVEFLYAALQNVANHWAGDHTQCDTYWPGCACYKFPSLHEGYYAKEGATHLAVAAFFLKRWTRAYLKHFVWACENYLVETYHAALLRCAPKRLHLPNLYEAMAYCSTMDWNENAMRDVLSMHARKSPCFSSIRGRSGVVRCLVAKTWFWKIWIARYMGLVDR